jgi:hypothetical protein
LINIEIPYIRMLFEEILSDDKSPEDGIQIFFLGTRFRLCGVEIESINSAMTSVLYKLYDDGSGVEAIILDGPRTSSWRKTKKKTFALQFCTYPNQHMCVEVDDDIGLCNWVAVDRILRNCIDVRFFDECQKKFLTQFMGGAKDESHKEVDLEKADAISEDKESDPEK